MPEDVNKATVQKQKKKKNPIYEFQWAWFRFIGHAHIIEC